MQSLSSTIWDCQKKLKFSPNDNLIIVYENTKH